MKYELIEYPDNPDHWHVEAFDDEGECIKAVFSGPGALKRAALYRKALYIESFELSKKVDGFGQRWAQMDGCHE